MSLPSKTTWQWLLLALINLGCIAALLYSPVPFKSNSNFHTLSRQWQLLQLLPNRHPGSTCAELLARLEDAGHHTSRRTVERDLVELSQIFPLQINNKGTPQGWYWPGGAGWTA